LKKLFKKNYDKIGILGGTFDPPHIGHLHISKIALKKLKLNNVIWVITKRNHLKKKPYLNIKLRIKLSKYILKKQKKISVKHSNDLINSKNTYDLLRYLKKNNTKKKLFFLMGADNLINFHKWHKWKQILKKSKIIVFDRHGYKKKSLNSKTYKGLNKELITFIEFNKVKISSSQLRKI